MSLFHIWKSIWFGVITWALPTTQYISHPHRQNWDLNRGRYRSTVRACWAWGRLGFWLCHLGRGTLGKPHLCPGEKRMGNTWLASWGWEPAKRGALGAAVGEQTLAGRPDVSSMTPLQLQQKKPLWRDLDFENLGKNWVGKKGFSNLENNKKKKKDLDFENLWISHMT